MARIEGTCDPRLAGVKDAFAANFDAGKEVGASVAVMIDGKPVVELWGGHADTRRTRPWNRDTLVNVYSTTKGLAAMCAHRLADQGRLDFDAPVVRYWPEFGQGGKDRIPVRFLLNHKAGLPAIRRRLPLEAIYQWDTMCAALAEQEPWWEPGTKHGYHAITYGWLVGEVVRRITGKSLGTYFRDEIARPLGADAYIGLDARHDGRTAEIVPAPPPRPGVDPLAEMLKDPESMQFKAIMNPAPVLDPQVVNGRAWRGAEIPAANGHATAGALARLYGALARGGEVDGYRLLRSEALPRCYAEQSSGMDAVLLRPTRFALGFMLSTDEFPLGPNLHTFGHGGAGGSLGFADPDAKLGFGYAMNQMAPDAEQGARALSLVRAVYASL
jgi:CubicO group peptidase (beta-lactamase class C family)